MQIYINQLRVLTPFKFRSHWYKAENFQSIKGTLRTQPRAGIGGATQGEKNINSLEIFSISTFTRNMLGTYVKVIKYTGFRKRTPGMTVFKRHSRDVYVLLTHSILCRLTHNRKNYPKKGGLGSCLKMWMRMRIAIIYCLMPARATALSLATLVCLKKIS